ncbi:hypothetical protein [uncultured Sphaerotilus sp.]|uniref:hypothetical protein n=1 Tax=uncultured Sphaerotilus sp. TaxID=474984 RepID=UPI0030CA19AF
MRALPRLRDALKPRAIAGAAGWRRPSGGCARDGPPLALLDDTVLAGGAQATVVLLIDLVQLPDDAVLAGGAGRDPGRRGAAGRRCLAVSADCYPLTSASSSRLVLPERIGSSMFRDGGRDGGRPELARKKPK